MLQLVIGRCFLQSEFDVSNSFLSCYQLLLLKLCVNFYFLQQIFPRLSKTYFIKTKIKQFFKFTFLNATSLKNYILVFDKNQFSCFNIALIDVFFSTICLQLQKNANALITVAVNFSKKGRTTTKHSKHIPRQNVVTVTVLCCICRHTGRHLLELIAVLSDFCCYFFSAANEEK